MTPPGAWHSDLEIGVDDPQVEDVHALLTTHLAFSHGVTPREYSFAMDASQLAEPDVTFFSARRSGRLVGIAALKRLDEAHGELKSMHVREQDRGRWIGRALVDHILRFARESGYGRVSLETGSTDEFAAARALYAKVGFDPCGPFGDYRPSPYNTFMTRVLLPELDSSGSATSPG